MSGASPHLPPDLGAGAFGTGVEAIDQHPYVLAARVAVPGPDPYGPAADTLEVFQDIEAETIKRGTLQQAQIRWNFVETEAGRLLAHSKDYRLVMVLLQSLSHSHMHQRFALGLQIAATFLALWSKEAHPRTRLKRSMAVRLAEAIEQLTPKSGTDFEEAGVLTGCGAAARICAQALAELAPEIGLSLAGLPARLEALSALTQLPRDAVPTNAASPSRSIGANDTVIDQIVPRPETLRLALDNERALRQSLSLVADFILRLEIANPLSYRLRRYATWFSITAAPPIRSGQRSVLPPVSEEAMDRYRTAVDRGQGDLDMVQRLERSCHIQPFWLEGQWLAARLAQVADRPAVAEAIREEACHFYAGLPAIRALTFSDGSPMVPDDVALWLAAARSPSQPPIFGVATTETADSPLGLDGDIQSIARNARALAKQGDLASALGALDNAKTAAGSLRAKTLWEVMLIEMLNEFGMKSYAQIQAQRLRDAVANVPAPEWEPDLFRRLARMEGKK